MDRDEALRVLEVLRRVVDRARDDAILENWGLVFIASAFLKAGGAVATHLLALRGETRPHFYLGLWAGLAFLELILVFVLRRRRTGERTFVERQVWTIWITFYAASALWAGVHFALRLPIEHLAPAFAVTSAFAFAQMASVVSPWLYASSASFAAGAAAMALGSRGDWLLLGGLWSLNLLIPGVRYHLRRVRRPQETFL